MLVQLPGLRVVRLALAALLLAALLWPSAVAGRPGFGAVGFEHHASTGAITPTLGPLTISPSTYTIGTAQGGVILGATPTSTITATGLPAFFTFNSGLRTISYDGTGTAGPGSFSFIETLAGANGSPKTSTINYTLNSGSIALLFDQSIGNGVDQNGHTDLPLRVGAHAYYLNASTGSDANSCTAAQSASTPKATVASVMSCVTDGAGDHVEIAEGTTYTSAPPDFSFMSGGFSLLYPAVAESYDVTDPTNNAKHGTANGSGSHARPSFSSGLQMIGGGQQYVAIRGLDINPGNVSGNHYQVTAIGSGWLLENNLFRYTGIALETDGGPVATHFIVRGNAIYGAWGGGDGAYLEGGWGTTVEDNVFYHNGWKIGGLGRDDATQGPTNQTHIVYQQHTTKALLRRNLYADGPADCGSHRDDTISQGNVHLYCPISVAAGGGVGALYASPWGDALDVSANAVLDGINLNSTTLYGWGLATSNGASISLARYNVFAHNDTTGNESLLLFSNNDGEQSYMKFDHNRAYQWTRAGHSYQASGAPSDDHPTTTNNVWDDNASGSNVNVSSVTFPNPALDTPALASGAGYASYAAMMQYAIDHPEAHIQRGLYSTIMAAYGQTGPPLIDLAMNTASWRTGNRDAGVIVGTQPESTLAFSGTWPSDITFDANTRFWYRAGTAPAGSGTGTITETPAGGGTPHATNIAWVVGTAPQLSSASVTGVTSTTATLNFTTDVGNGTAYGALDSLADSFGCGASGPCKALYPGQVKGCSNGHATFTCTSQAVTATGAQAVTFTGLTPNTDYWASAMQISAGGVWSPTTDALHAIGNIHFTTSAAGSTWSLSTSTPSPASTYWQLSGGNLVGTVLTTSGATGSQIYLRANTAKTSGTFTIAIAGGKEAATYEIAIGLDDGAETGELGFSTHSWGFYSVHGAGGGDQFYNSTHGDGGTLTAGFTDGDQVKVIWNQSTGITLQKFISGSWTTIMTRTTGVVGGLTAVYPVVMVKDLTMTGETFTISGW